MNTTTSQITTAQAANIAPDVAASFVRAALVQARGSYQRALLEGDETWSGSTLKGKAREWGARYDRSRRELVHRIAIVIPGAHVPLVRGEDGRARRELVVRVGEDLVTWDSLRAVARTAPRS